MREHADKFGPGILLVGLALLLEDGTDAVEGAVEPVCVPETEIEFPVLQCIHHVGHLFYVLTARTDGGDHRHDNRDK